MKSIIFKLFFLGIIVQFVACKPDEPRYQYKYNDKPAYTWGYAEFYGNFYNYAEIPQNVVTLSLFSDSLFINDKGSLTGHGQYLFIEDIFISPTDTILPNGVYKVDTTAAPMTFYPGEFFAVDENKFPQGAYLYYIEKRATFSTVKYISKGSFIVRKSSQSIVVDCDFVMSDGSVVKGSFNGALPYDDQSEQQANQARKKLKLATEIALK